MKLMIDYEMPKRPSHRVLIAFKSSPSSFASNFVADGWEGEQHPFKSIGYGKWELVLSANQVPKHQSILKVICKPCHVSVIAFPK